MTASRVTGAGVGAARVTSGGDAALKSGIYGLFRLDGAPVDRRDAQSLGLVVPGDSVAALGRAIDPHAPSAASHAEDQGALTILLGEVEEAEALAARLSLTPSAPPAVLARAALHRFGSDTPGEMIGEWSLLHWDRTGRLTLMMSAARRDPLLFALQGPRVAVAPDLFRLARIAWIGATLDEAGLLFSLARVDLRAQRGDRTMLARVLQIEPATCVTIDRNGCRKQTTQILAGQPRWSGAFEDAVDEAELVMRRVMATRLARTSAPAVLLSGGLDSSLLAWLAAEECGADQKLQLFTSAAPPGSGLRDETDFADAVAERLGLQTERVAPPPEADIYRPPDAILAGANGPPLSNRHCLTEAFQATARKTGATLLVNGTYGEMTLSARSRSIAVRGRFRRLAGGLYRRLRTRRAPATAETPFHVRLSPGRHADLPEATRAALASASHGSQSAASDRWGYRPGIEKALQRDNEFYAGALRMDFPYRDLRLVRLFAAFPSNLLPPHAVDRGMARTMLAGHLPDPIRLRTSGLPAEPDHFARLQRQAPAARARIAAFRAAEVQAWLDLEWLDSALAEMGERGTTDARRANEVLLTAMAAEFLCWWRARS